MVGKAAWQAMSEFAPGSPWKAIVLPASLPPRAPVRPLAISKSPRRVHARSIRPAEPKNLAKSGTCDVPPRDPAGAIEYY
jgi:hypothetical protein